MSVCQQIMEVVSRAALTNRAVTSASVALDSFSMLTAKHAAVRNHLHLINSSVERIWSVITTAIAHNCTNCL